MSQKLTPKQKKFCDYYISSGNATESAIKAGYSKKTAKQMGAENLTKPYLKDYIKKHTVEDEEYRMLKAENRQKMLSDIFEGKVYEDKLIIDSDGETKIIQEPMSWDIRLKANEQLNKMQGEYLQRVDLKGEIKTDKMNEILEQLKED